MVGVAALSLIAAPAIADTNRIADRVGIATKHEDDNLVPAAVLIGAAALVIIAIATNNSDDSKSN